MGQLIGLKWKYTSHKHEKKGIKSSGTRVDTRESISNLLRVSVDFFIIFYYYFHVEFCTACT